MGGAPAAAAPAAGAPATKRQPGQGGDGALITGCQAHETSADACPNNDPAQAFGAMTNALTSIVAKHKQQNPNAPISYRTLVTEVRAQLHASKFTQNPCLECAGETVDKPFVC
jgi:Caspase domain